MRLHASLLALLLGGLCLGLGRPAPPPADGTLHDTMEELKSHLKATAVALKRDGSTEEILHHVAEMERLVLLAKLETPPNLDQIPETGRAEHALSFRRDLVEVLQVIASMELDVLDGRRDDAAATIVDPLFPMRERAHELYQRKD